MLSNRETTFKMIDFVLDGGTGARRLYGGHMFIQHVGGFYDITEAIYRSRLDPDNEIRTGHWYQRPVYLGGQEHLTASAHRDLHDLDHAVVPIYRVHRHLFDHLNIQTFEIEHYPIWSFIELSRDLECFEVIEPHHPGGFRDFKLAFLSESDAVIGTALLTNMKTANA